MDQVSERPGLISSLHLHLLCVRTLGQAQHRNCDRVSPETVTELHFNNQPVSSTYIFSMAGLDSLYHARSPVVLKHSCT